MEHFGISQLDDVGAWSSSSLAPLPSPSCGCLSVRSSRSMDSAHHRKEAPALSVKTLFSQRFPHRIRASRYDKRHLNVPCGKCTFCTC
jgi:hypothetical protein